MRKTLPVFLLLAMIAIPPLSVFASFVTVPSGLEPGDQYRLAFFSSTTMAATSSNIADYNAFVTGVADSVPQLAALNTTWSVIGSTATVNAEDNTGTNPSIDPVGVPIYWTDGALMDPTYAALWSGPVQDYPSFETGGNPFGLSAEEVVFTGTGGGGQALDPLGSDTVRVGITDNDGGWVDWSVAQGGQLSFYGMSGVLTVAPEPSSLALLSLGAVALLAVGRRRMRTRAV